MTHIHPDSIRLLLRCGWEAWQADDDDCGTFWRNINAPLKLCNYTTTEALALCREGEKEADA